MLFLIFFAVLAILAALTYAFLPEKLSVAKRLSRMLDAAALVRESGFKERNEKLLKDALASIGWTYMQR